MFRRSSRYRRRFLAIPALVASLALPAVGPGSALATTLPAECAAAGSTVTCTYTSGDSTFTVPANVASIHVVAVGGRGASTGGASGGAGALIAGDLQVTAGSTLHAVVGGNAVAGAGGANGGGNGAGAAVACGGGGGASDVRTSPALGDRVLVAAGGGGAGCQGRVTDNPSGPGGGGGDATAPGATGETLLNDNNWAGHGGGSGCSSAQDSSCGLGGLGVPSGADGALGSGGAGGVAAIPDNAGSPGGGGGGGLYGGGGGGTGGRSQTCTFLGCVLWVVGAGGGGGGGSNLVPAGGSASTDTTGVPLIAISYVISNVQLPQASVSPATLAFGNVRVGSPSASQQVTVTAGADGGSLHLGGLSVTGSNAADFGLGVDTCSGATLAPSEACTVVVTFVPAARGLRSASLQVPDDAADSPQTVALSGTGVAPVAHVAPASIDFGTVTIASTSGHRTVTITNTGDTGQSLILASETITGPNASEFAFAGDTCITQSIAAGSSCTIDLTFTPAAAGHRSATFTISDNGLGSPHTVSLTGTGGVPSADLAVGISASPNPVKSGQKMTYTITVLNAGPSTAMGVLINDSLSSQSTFVSATVNQGTCVTPAKGASGVVSCSLGAIANGSSQPIQIVVTVIAKKNSVTNTVTVSATTSDPNLANNTAWITIRVK